MAARPQFDLSFLSLKPVELNAFLAPYTATLKTDKLVTSEIIPYSFYSNKGQLPDTALNDPDVLGAFVFQPFSGAEQGVARAILSMLEDSTGLRFSEVTAGSGELRFGKYNMKSGFAGYTYNPGDFEEGYTPLFINTTLEGNTRAFTQTFLHELGHALNFKHPGLYDTGDSNPVLPANLDSSLMSVMSYSDYEYNMSYSPLDLKAYRELYGRNDNPTPKQYVFTAQGEVASQTVEGATYRVNLVDKDLFWIVDGPHTYDFSKASQGTQGVHVNAGLGAVRWSTPEDWISIDAWQPVGPNIKTLARLTETANVRFFYPDAGTASSGTKLALTDSATALSDPLSRLILTDKDDMIVMFDEQSVFNFIDTGLGNDSFVGFIDGLVLDGGEGLDDLQLLGVRDAYEVIRSTQGFSIGGLDGDKMFIEAIDRLHFDDVSLAFDYAGAGGEVFRAYSALGRTPDLEGMGYWLDALDRGADAAALANGLVQSEEFSRLYGATDPVAFVQKLYLTALQRAVDTAGQSFWVDQLNSGASRASVMDAIVQSPESIALHASAASGGMPFYEWDWLGSR